MEKYKRVKVLGKGSFGHAVLVTVAKDPSKQYVVVRHPPITARPSLRSAVSAVNKIRVNNVR
jgi:glycerol-3-phosphate dehydrogenase